MSARPISDAPGVGAIATRGWFAAHKYLIVRRAAQAVFLAVFLSGPWLGVWIAKGTLASSMSFDVLPLTDPFILLQSLLAGHWPEGLALIGAGIVLAAYLLVGGRAYCSWVCPINPVTDAAAALRTRWGIGKGWRAPKKARLWLLGAALLASALVGSAAWETINPITQLHRALVFGGVGAWLLVAAVFLIDLLLIQDGWCGHLCPVGAFYGLLGKGALLRVTANNRDRCNQCQDCYNICPEPLVITPALKGTAAATPLILSGDCTNCGRCVDVCSKSVFTFTTRFDRRPAPAGATRQPERGAP